MLLIFQLIQFYFCSTSLLQRLSHSSNNQVAPYDQPSDRGEKKTFNTKRLPVSPDWVMGSNIF